MDTERTRCLIVGSGPAGYTAAIYAARANLAPVLYEGMEPGGQLTTTTKIENFPGFPDGILGAELMEAMKKQAQQLGVDIRFGIATGVDFSSSPRKVTIDGRKIVETDAVIIATGAQAKYLGLESETLFKGQGVSACATCDGFFYRNQDVIVVGGGDSACEEATYLASICNKVYMVVRKDHLRASKAMQRRVMETPNIEIKFGYNTVQARRRPERGDRRACPPQRRRGAGDRCDRILSGDRAHAEPRLFSKARWSWTRRATYGPSPARAARACRRVFAAGDVQDPHYRQAITAAGSGRMAALDCERYLLGL